MAVRRFPIQVAFAFAFAREVRRRGVQTARATRELPTVRRRRWRSSRARAYEELCDRWTQAGGHDQFSRSCL